MKRYKFEITVEEGYDEFWELMKGTGCDEILKLLTEALEEAGFGDAEIKLAEYSDK